MWVCRFQPQRTPAADLEGTLDCVYGELVVEKHVCFVLCQLAVIVERQDSGRSLPKGKVGEYKFV